MVSSSVDGRGEVKLPRIHNPQHLHVAMGKAISTLSSPGFQSRAILCAEFSVPLSQHLESRISRVNHIQQVFPLNTIDSDEELESVDGIECMRLGIGLAFELLSTPRARGIILDYLEYEGDGVDDWMERGRFCFIIDESAGSGWGHAESEAYGEIRLNKMVSDTSRLGVGKRCQPCHPRLTLSRYSIITSRPSAGMGRILISAGAL